MKQGPTLEEAEKPTKGLPVTSIGSILHSRGSETNIRWRLERSEREQQ